MSLTVNMIVTGGPDGEKKMHFKGGTMGPGHDDSGKTEVTVPYDLARKLLIENDMGAAMSGFMSGQIKIKGDMTKLMGIRPMDHTNPIETDPLSNEELISSILDGKGSYMPAWRGILSQQDAEALVSYIRLLSQ